MNRLYILIFMVISILSISLSVFAKTQGVFTNTGIGGRSSVFGESFVAIADDASAIYWNPAGISKLANRYNATASRINLFSGFTGISDINYNFFSFVFSNHPWGGGISLDWLGTDEIIASDALGNIDDPPHYLSYAEYKISPAISLRYRKLGSVGISGHYFWIPTETSTSDWDITLGLLSNKRIITAGEKYECWFRFGAAARNLLNTIDSSIRRYTIAFAFCGRFDRLGTFNIAMAYPPWASKNSSKLTTSLEWNLNEWKSLHGANLNFYGGFDYYHETNVKPWKLGFGIERDSWLLNYSFEWHPFLKDTHRVALNLRWNRNETVIFIKKLQDGKEVDTDNEFKITDDIVIRIDVSDDVQIESVKAAQPKLVCFEKIDVKQSVKKLEKSYQDMKVDGQDYILRYILKPVEHRLYPGTYIVSVYARGRKLQSAEFSLSYNRTAEQFVVEAYNSLIQGDLERAKNYLFGAVRVERNYPNTYYVAGIISEISRDFEGAQKCYLKASELSGGRKIRHLETEINPKEFAELDYLQKYAESQRKKGIQGIGLYEELEHVVSPR